MRAKSRARRGRGGFFFLKAEASLHFKINSKVIERDGRERLVIQFKWDCHCSILLSRWSSKYRIRILLLWMFEHARPHPCSHFLVYTFITIRSVDAVVTTAEKNTYTVFDKKLHSDWHSKSLFWFADGESIAITIESKGICCSTFSISTRARFFFFFFRVEHS